MLIYISPSLCYTFLSPLHVTCYEVGELSRCLQVWSKPLWGVDHFGSGPCWLGELDHFGCVILLVMICAYMGVRHAWEVPPPLQVNVSAWSLCHSWWWLLYLVSKKMLFYVDYWTQKHWYLSSTKSNLFQMHVLLVCVFLDPHLITHLSYIGVQFVYVTKVGPLTLPTTELGTVSSTQPHHVNNGLGEGHVYLLISKFIT